jgi:hypothetical protein
MPQSEPLGLCKSRDVVRTHVEYEKQDRQKPYARLSRLKSNSLVQKSTHQTNQFYINIQKRQSIPKPAEYSAQILGKDAT